VKITPREYEFKHYSTGRGMVPSVTAILDIVTKRHIDAWRMREGRDKADQVLRSATLLGTRVHLAAAQIAQGDGAEIDRDLEPYVNTICDFLNEHVDEVLAVELDLTSLDLAFGGTLDLYCRLKSGEHAIVDWKTSRQLTREGGLQLAAYRLLARYHGFGVDRLIAVRIRKEEGKTGTHYVRYYDEDANADEEAFLALLRFWWWRHKSHEKPSPEPIEDRL
jgi:hypothetical protein